MTTFSGHANLRGESLAQERNEGPEWPEWHEWQRNPAVQAALAQAADVSWSPSDQGKDLGGTWIPLTGVERASRSIYW